MTDAAHLSEVLSGRYRVEREIGAGGMATVYLAYDERHDRKVALKTLRPDLAAIMGADRFLSEIRTTANLQHPHILPLFDSGEAHGLLFYVMPYVEGESLRSRLDREKQLPVDEAVRIAQAVASALHYAHRQGVIHRDVKPENVLLHDGEPLVADFGIALAVSAAASGRLTETGVSLGTPYYMSPEQATAERDLGPASDVYSLGCVLYEMLVGEPPHTGHSAQAVLAKILTETPRPVTELRHTIPRHVGATVSRALERLAADRFATADAFARALDDPTFGHEATPSVARRTTSPHAGTTAPRAPHWRQLLSYGLPALAMGTALGLMLKGAPTRTSLIPIRFVVTGDSLHTPTTGCCGPSVAISPDGRQVAYLALWNGVTAIAVRPIDETVAHRIAGSDGAGGLFFSPDGAWIGFQRASSIEKIRVSGGTPVTILSNVDQGVGATWLSDNTIVYSTTGGGLQRVSADGGPIDTISPPGHNQSEGAHLFPSALPDGPYVLFVLQSIGSSGRWIEVMDVSNGERRRLFPGTSPQYSGTGQVLYAAADGALMAQPFDLVKRATVGNSVRVEEGVMISADGLAEFGVSQTGTIVARSGHGISLSLTLVERNGDGRAVGPLGDLRAPRFSPDGRQIAYEMQGDMRGEPDNVWIYDLSRGTERRLTFEGDNSWPTWRADGQAVLFDRDDDSLSGIYEQAADGSGSAQIVVARDAWEPHAAQNGRWLIWSEITQGGADLWMMDMESRKPRPFLASPFLEATPNISPNGKWVAYSSNESGNAEVYVQPFPEGGARHRVSLAGGIAPLWRSDGTELYYRNGHDVVAVRVVAEEAFRIVGRETLFADVYQGEGFPGINWDISPDGTSFAMIDSRRGTGQITVSVNALQTNR